MKRTAFHYVLPICVLACALGCNREVESLPAATTAVVEAPAPPAPVEEKSEAKALAEPELANPKEDTANKPAVATFTPPFPERLDLFEAPKRAQSNIRRDDEHGETVELKGFVNVDQPKAVLSIDGNTSLVPEGGEKYGVHVISIQPPSVVLQRGRNRWTATLE